MDKKFKNIIQWTIFAFIVLVCIISIISLIIIICQPTLFPSIDISGFKNYTTYSSVVLSFLSASMGIFSIWQANLSNQQFIQMTNEMKEMKDAQNVFFQNIMKITQHNIELVVAATNGIWQTDLDTE